MPNYTSEFFNPIDMTIGALGYLVVGVPSAVCSLVVAGAIGKYSALHDRKEMLLLMALAIADTLNLLSHVSAGIYRLIIIYITKTNKILVTRRACLVLPHVWLWPFTVPLSHLMLVFVSLDRLLLVILRENYIVFKWEQKYKICTTVVPFFISFLFSAICWFSSFLEDDGVPSLDPMCQDAQALTTSTLPSKMFVKWYTHSQWLFPLLSVILFALVPPFYKFHQNKVSPTQAWGPTEIKERLAAQHKITRNVAWGCLCTMLLSSIPGGITYYFLAQGNYIAAICCRLLVLTNPLANIFIYQFGNSDMRLAMRSLLRCHELPQNIDLWHAKRPSRIKEKQSRDSADRDIEMKDI